MRQDDDGVIDFVNAVKGAKGTPDKYDTLVVDLLSFSDAQRATIKNEIKTQYDDVSDIVYME